MDNCLHNKYIFNNNIFPSSEFRLPLLYDFCIYEVIRVIDGIPLFIEDHNDRLFISAKAKSVIHLFKDFDLSMAVKSLIAINNFISGNIKIACYIHENKMSTYLFYIPHSYPDIEQYNVGVKLKSLNAMRNDPNAKVIHENLKQEVDNILKDKTIYEVLLVNNLGNITEGSRSNIFFIKNNSVYTACGKDVLIGITRKYIIDCVKSLNIPFYEEDIALHDLKSFQGAFVSGTSPKVLPICEIDDIKFNLPSTIINSILEKYNELIQNYIVTNKLK